MKNYLQLPQSVLTASSSCPSHNVACRTLRGKLASYMAKEFHNTQEHQNIQTDTISCSQLSHPCFAADHLDGGAARRGQDNSLW